MERSRNSDSQTYMRKSEIGPLQQIWVSKRYGTSFLGHPVDCIFLSQVKPVLDVGKSIIVRISTFPSSRFWLRKTFMQPNGATLQIFIRPQCQETSQCTKISKRCPVSPAFILHCTIFLCHLDLEDKYKSIWMRYFTVDMVLHLLNEYEVPYV